MEWVNSTMVSVFDCDSKDPCSIHGSPKEFFVVNFL